MKVNLSSGAYEILNYGQVFLFGVNENFKMDISMDNGFEFAVNIEFRNDGEGDQRIEKRLEGNVIHLTCYHFNNQGTGLTKPMSIAKVDGKEVLLMFWAYLEGGDNGKVRTVKYTLFRQM